MATVNLGSIKFKWKGTYAGGTAYTIDDVVSYNGSSYICIQASTGNLPTNATYFEQMSSAGTNGTNGTDLTSTLTAQGDIVYRDGSGLAKLGAGTSGQVLQTGGTGANPSWVDASGGKIGAVTNTMITDVHTLTTGANTWTSIGGFNATITPTKAGSSILVMGHISSGSTNGGPAGHGFKLYRNVNSAGDVAMTSFQGDTAGNRMQALVAGASESGSTWVQENGGYNIIDTSSTGLSYTLGNTVKYQMYWSANSANSVVLNRSYRDENGWDDVRSTSSITLMEVLA